MHDERMMVMMFRGRRILVIMDDANSRCLLLGQVTSYTKETSLALAHGR